MKKIILLIFFMALSIIFFIGCKNRNIKESNLDFKSQKISSVAENITIKPENQQIAPKNTINTETNIKDEVLIGVPFADQAPHRDWGEPYQEACEETSIIMANQFIRGNQTEDLDKDYINQEIVDMVSWQEANLGGHYDLDASMTLDLFKNYYTATKMARLLP